MAASPYPRRLVIPPQPANSAAVCRLEQAIACHAGLRAQVAEALVALYVNLWERHHDGMRTAEERWAAHLVGEAAPGLEVYT